MAVKLIIDSAADFPKDEMKHCDLITMPIYVYVDDQEYQDGVTIQADDVYHAAIKGADIKTSQIPVGDYYKVFSELEEGHEYICTVFSSKLSGTYSSAVMAASKVREERPNLVLEVINTKGVVAGEALIIRDAMRAIEQGASKDEVVSLIQELIPKMRYIFSVDELKSLIKGGRLSKEKGFIANVLNIKPVLALEDEEIQLKAQARGSAKKIEKMVELFKSDVSDLSGAEVWLGYGANTEELKKLEMKLRELGVGTIKITQVGATLGAHLGPSVIALCYKADRDI